MTQFAPETEKRIAAFEAQREREIREIERLWKAKTGKPLRELDEAINKRFQVADGRRALSFDSIRIIREGLENLNLKEEK